MQTNFNEKERRRSSRRRRVRGRGARLVDRDIDILLALLKMRLLRTTDISSLYFSAVGTCQKRLRKLFDAGLVRSIVTDLAQENRYGLTPLGHRLLEEALPDGAVPAYRPAPRVDSRGAAHLDLMNQYRIALARAAPEHGVKLVRFTPEWELRSAEPLAKLIPDAAVVLAVDRRRIEVALEIDIGTESPSVVAKKVMRYQAARLQDRRVCGVRFPVVLIIARTPGRARSLARALLPINARGVLLGAAPLALEHGGLVHGLAPPVEAAKWKAEAEVAVFGNGLLSVTEDAAVGSRGRGNVGSRPSSARDRNRRSFAGSSSRYRSARS